MNRSPILNMWAIVLGAGIGNRRIENGRQSKNFARTLILFWLLLWFFVRTCYEGTIYTQRNTLYSPLDMVEKIQASDCRVLLSPAGHKLAPFFESER